MAVVAAFVEAEQIFIARSAEKWLYWPVVLTLPGTIWRASNNTAPILLPPG